MKDDNNKHLIAGDACHLGNYNLLAADMKLLINYSYFYIIVD